MGKMATEVSNSTVTLFQTFLTYVSWHWICGYFVQRADRKGDVKALNDYFKKNKEHIESLMTDISTAEKKFAGFREEMNLFRADLKEYYGFFVQQCDLILSTVSDNQMFNNKEHADLKQKLTLQGH